MKNFFMVMIVIYVLVRNFVISMMSRMVLVDMKLIVLIVWECSIV